MRYRRLAALLFLALLCATGMWLWQRRGPRVMTLPAGRPTMRPVANAGAVPVPRVPSAWTSVERRIFDLSNEARVKARLKPLRREDVLRDAAVLHSKDMLNRHFFDHVNPSGEGPEDRISQIHRRLVGTTGENIWEGIGNYYASTPDLARVIMDEWMRSPGHRANILRKEFTHLGVGVVIRGQDVRATQDFARVRAYLSVPLRKRAAAGTAVNLSTQGEPPRPEMFDLERLPAAERRGAMNPKPIAGARLDAAPGKYRVRLYFPAGRGEFEVFGGPTVVLDR